MFFLDTSILAAYYMPERKTSAIQKILSKPSPKIISPLVHVEPVSYTHLTLPTIYSV